jgi:transposase
VLQALYRVKQRLNRLMLLKNINSKKVRKRIPQLLQLIGQLQESPAHALARTLLSWIEPIIRMWRLSRSNGISKGFHSKTKMISRRAYGFRNFENAECAF